MTLGSIDCDAKACDSLLNSASVIGTAGSTTGADGAIGGGVSMGGGDG